jgi:hypothetical protein
LHHRTGRRREVSVIVRVSQRSAEPFVTEMCCIANLFSWIDTIEL